MNQIQTIEEILSGAFSVPTTETKTDRVLKSTRIEQNIFNDLHVGMESLETCEKQGKQKLRSFGSLVEDVFQSVYGLRPRYTEEENLSAISREFNRGILSDLMDDKIYSAIKSVCEGKELPSIHATEEFVSSIFHNLSSLMNKATGGKGQVNGLDTMEQDKVELEKKLAEQLKRLETALPEQREAMEKKVIQTANRILAKEEQIQGFSRIVQGNMRQNAKAMQMVVSSAAKEALERANLVTQAVSAWGNDEDDMQKNSVNMEILKRVAASEKLRYITQFLGRYREMLTSKRLAGYTYGQGEKYDVELGNHFSRALTSELALLATPEAVPLFLRKYQRKALKQYRKREPEYKGGGDVIACVDESASTFGENNAYAVAVALVLYELCRINHANFALVHFASGVKTDYFPKDEQVPAERLLDCAETFLNGGTNFEKPLREAFALTATGKMDKPNIFFITDGICRLSDEFLFELEEFKADTGAKLTGILLDAGENLSFSLEKFADKVYRTSELLKDEIVESIIEERI